MQRQPLLHDLLAAVTAPSQAWSGPDGQIRARGAQGVYHSDVRVLSEAVLTCDGEEPEAIAGGASGPGTVEVISLLRGPDGPGADPTLRLRRRRTVRPGVVSEQLEVGSAGTEPVHLTLALQVACDFADMEAVKQGHPTAPHGAAASGDDLRWTYQGTDVVLRAPGSRTVLNDGRRPVVAWDLEVAPGAVTVVDWKVESTSPGAVVLPAPDAPSWTTPHVECDDRRLTALVNQALDDLYGLRMRSSRTPQDVFLAAGAPWFFTLFGRDSLWAARMMLPLGTDLAAGTLRTLAAYQGTAVDAETAEQPGKILHEVRAKELPLGEGDRVLPPLYYGTVDATPLWVCLLHDAWRWGLPPTEVESFLPALEAALGWMADHGDADGDGFLEYLDEGGRGLANQGWKDSGDSIQWQDGTLADGPIALCEVQAYAYEAAMGGAALLDAFGRPGGDRWRGWAKALAERFREQFWVGSGADSFPAIALDAHKRPVDTLTSNIGHLLGTGLLDEEEEARVASHLASPRLSSGYGLRTLSTDAGGFWPLRYHGGTVWSHDTAIAVHGLVRSGRTSEAAVLAEGLLLAGEATGYRLPELHSGDALGAVPTLVPYPAACRPQAWSAASAVVLLTGYLGLTADVPSGELEVSPLPGAPVGALRVDGLQVGGERLSIDISRDGSVGAVRAPAGLRVRTPG